MTGGVGGDTSLVSVEVLKEDGSPWCSLPDLPDNRHLHSQTGLLSPYNGSIDNADNVPMHRAGGLWRVCHQYNRHLSHLHSER